MQPADLNRRDISEECLARLNAGDKKAVDTVFDTYFQYIHAFAWNILQDSWAEDIAMTTFNKVYDRKKPFDSIQHLKGFLFQTTRNACLNYLRGNRNLRKKHQEWGHIVEEIDPSQPDYEKVWVNNIARLIARLDEIDGGDVVRMYYLESKTNQEIADALGITVENVYTRKSRAIKDLRNFFPGDFLVFCLLFGFGPWT